MAYAATYNNVQNVQSDPNNKTGFMCLQGCELRQVYQIERVESTSNSDCYGLCLRRDI